MRVNQIQGSDEWLKWRKGKISGSMMSSIMGVNPWRSRNKLWKQVLGIISEDELNSHMKRGQDLEPVARELIEQRLLCSFPPVCFQHDIDDWAIASLDGIDETEETIIEIKCPAKRCDGVPDYYVPQMQWGMYCSGAKKCYYASFTEDQLDLFVVVRDDDYIEKMRKEALLFREQVRTLEEPEPDASDCELITDDEAIHFQAEFEELDKEAKSWSAKRDLVRSKLIAIANGRNIRINNLIISKVRRQGAIQYDKIPDLQGKDLSEYRKPPFDMYRITRKK